MSRTTKDLLITLSVCVTLAILICGIIWVGTQIPVVMERLWQIDGRISAPSPPRQYARFIVLGDTDADRSAKVAAQRGIFNQCELEFLDRHDKLDADAIVYCRRHPEGYSNVW